MEANYYMYKDNIMNSWWADIYDQFVTETDDIEFLLSVIGSDARNVLEVCCGSGRILVPLAKAGHNVTGFDADEAMLSKIPAKAKGLNNIRYFRADAVYSDWGSGYDIVVLAGNILINIESDMDYRQAQQLFFKKAAESLKTGGYVYLDFSLMAKPEQFFGQSKERVIFEGTDSKGNYGKYIISGGTYDKNTQIDKCIKRTELVTKDDVKIIEEKESIKHIPTLINVHEWLAAAGFVVKAEYGDYSGKPISEDTCRAIIFAEKTGIK